MKNNKFVIGMSLSVFGAAALLAGCGNAKTYTITFVSNGSDVSPLTLEWGKSVTRPEDPTKVGYTFTGWYTDESCTIPFDFENTKVETSFSIYGGWTINSYTVSFVSNVEGVLYEPIVGKYGSSISLPTPERANYTFGGWYTDEACTEEYNGKISGSNITVYAKWIECTYNIAFNKNNEAATGTMDPVHISEADSDKKLPSNKFRLEGYDFKGWSDSATGEVKYADQEDFEHIPENANITLYAVWEIKHLSATFYSVEGGLTSSYATTNADYGEKVVLPESEPSYTGHTFTNYGKMVPTEDKVAVANKVYYKHIAEAGQQYMVNPVKADTNIENMSLYEVSDVNISDEIIKGNAEFYARFVKNQYKVKIIDDVTDSESSVTLYTGESFALPTQVEKTGYTAKGFYLDEACTNKITTSSIIISASDVTIYSHYSVNTYSILVKDGSRDVAQYNDVDFGSDITALVAEPSKIGYSFVGYYEDPLFDEESKIDLSTMPAKNLTLYAKFEINKHSLSFDIGEGASKDVTLVENIEYGTNIAALLSVGATRVGYDFGGWTLSPEITDGKMPDSDVVATANWIVQGKTITFNRGHDDDGKLDELQKKLNNKEISQEDYEAALASYDTTIYHVNFGEVIKDNDAVVIPSDPTRTGYKFLGWFDSQGNKLTEEAFDNLVVPVNNVEYVAKWEAVEVDVTVHFMLANLVSEGGYTEDTSLQKTVKAVTASEFEWTSATADSVEHFVFDGSDKVTVKADGSSEMYAFYSRETYDVTFVKSDESASEVVQNVEYGSKVSVPSSLKEVGYSITTKIGDEPVSLSTHVVESDETITLYYEEAFGLILDYNGGVDSEGNEEGKVLGDPSTTVTLPDEEPTRVGYTFAGYYTEKDGGTLIGETVDLDETGKLTIYAHWTVNSYTYSFFDDVPEEGVALTPITKNYGESISGEIPQPTKTGYTFEGWYKHPAGADPVKVTLGSTMGAEDLTLYAHWTVNSYKLIFDANGGAFLDTTTSKVVSGDYDSSFVKANLPADPTLSGKVFVGWSSVKDDASKIIDFDNYKYGAQDATVYAVWRDPIINFVGEETSTYAPIQETAGSDIEFLNEPEKEGYSFSGWAYVDKDGNFVDKDGKALADGADPERFYFNEMPSKDVYITALWSLNKYEVIYISNGGSIVTNVDGSGNVITYTHGSTNESLVKPADPTREGYEFGGWYYVDGTVSGEWLDANKVFNGDDSVNAKTFNADDIYVYARWIAKEYTIIYMNNGVVYGEPVVVKYGEQIPEIAAPENGNKAFVGWYTADGTGDKWGESFDAYIMPAIDKNGGSTQITLYARFNESIKFVEYRDLDGNIICSGNYGMTLEDYILSVLKESEAYQEIYDAIEKAVKAATEEEGGSMLEISTLGVYATLGNLDQNTLLGVLGLSQETLDSMTKSKLSDDNEYMSNLMETGDILTATSDSIAALYAAAQDGGIYSDIFDAAQAAMGGDTTNFLGYGATAIVLNACPGIEQEPAVEALVNQGIDEATATGLYSLLSELPADYIKTLADATNNLLATQEKLTYLGTQAAENPTDTLYASIYNAVQAAIGGSQDQLIEYIKGANVLYYSNPTRDGILSFLICNASSDVGVENMSYVLDFVGRFNEKLNPSQNAEFYAYLAEKIPQGQDGLMEITTPIGLALENKTTEYNAYEAAGYVPFSSDPSKVFDHWEQIIKGDTITYIPASISKQQPVSDISVYGATNSTVTFSWNEVAGSYGYKVIVTVTKADGTVVEYEPHIVTDTNYKVSGLLKGDEVSIKVIALKAGPNGEYREFSSTVEAISLKDGTPISNVPIRLDSDPTVTEYLHSTENDIGKVSKSGDFYYVTKDDDGNETYIFFANTTYSFGGKAVNLVDASGATKTYRFASVGVNDKNDPAIITNENLSKDEAENVMYFTAGDASVKKAIVRALPGSISYGTDFAEFNSVKVTDQTKSSAAVDAADFLATQKEAYKIGVEIASAEPEEVSGSKYSGFVTTDEHGVATYHNNGFKFDVQNLAKTGKEMPLDRSYTFYKYNASKEQYEQIELESIASYDLDTDAFYFKAGVAEESDLFKVVIAAKADIKDEYTNTYVPEIYKKEDDGGNSKFKGLKQEIVFKLTDGVNVYDLASLRSAMADKDVSGINLHRNIKGKLPANSVVYMKAAQNLPDTDIKNLKKDVKELILGSEDSELKEGDVDIVENTAVMAKEGVAGSTKIWVVDNSENAVFHDINNVGYSYDGINGEYSIVDAEWTNAKVVKDSDGKDVIKNSYETGAFKIISTSNNSSSKPKLEYYGFATGNIIERSGQGSDSVPGSRYKDLTFNGNYFKIDASKTPFIRSSSTNNAGTVIATYSIQNVKSCIIRISVDAAVSINNLELIGNTENSSAGLTGNEKNVGEIMKRASGGLSGINNDCFDPASKKFCYNNNKVHEIKGVNVTNTLIGLYTDTTSHVSFTHVKNSWANGLYCYSDMGDTISVDHSVIESSGGAALQVDDQIYGSWKDGGTGGEARVTTGKPKDSVNYISEQGNILNSTYSIDYSTTRVENFVCGDEQWFKGYTMEVVALGLKATINKMVSAQGYTIVQPMVNQATGLSGEYMNWVFFSRTDGIPNQENRHANDIGCAINFGDFYYTGEYDEKGFYYANPNSDYIVLLGPVDDASMDALAAVSPGSPARLDVLDLAIGAQQAVSISIVDKNTLVPVESYLYFRQFQDGLGWLQGMVQLFPKNK